jgi:hypothetical protein
VRVVANVGDDMVLGIEPGAPRDAGGRVTFIARPFSAAYPEQREGQPPSTKIKVDNVNRELVPQIRAALGTREYIQVLYREPALNRDRYLYGHYFPNAKGSACTIPMLRSWQRAHQENLRKSLSLSGLEDLFFLFRRYR